jgi:protein-tyrosine phosphatase
MNSVQGRGTGLGNSSEANANANEIIPRLWLGNIHAAGDGPWLKSKNITAIFNCTKNIPFLLDPPMTLYRIPLDDNLEAVEIRNARLWSFEGVYRIAAEYNAGKTILIHCYAGMQRSAAFVAMFLIFLTCCDPDTAIAYIKQRRPIAFHRNANFYDAIVGFHADYMKYIYEKNLSLKIQPRHLDSLWPN